MRDRAVKTILYSHCDPDHTMGMRVIEQLRMDWLSVSVGKVCENPITVADNPLREELFTMEEVIALRDKYRIGEVIITHLEEDWGKSYDDYRELEKQYENVRFAYDGLELCL